MKIVKIEVLIMFKLLKIKWGDKKFKLHVEKAI